MRRSKVRIVVVSPFSAERMALHQLLVGDGHDVSAVATPEEGLVAASRCPPDAVIADAQVAGVDGVALAHAIVRRGLRSRVILVCPRATSTVEAQGVVCLTKPIDLCELRRHLDGEGALDAGVA